MAVHRADPEPVAGKAYALSVTETVIICGVVVALATRMAAAPTPAVLAMTAAVLIVAGVAATASVVYVTTRTPVPVLLRLLRYGCAAAASLAHLI